MFFFSFGRTTRGRSEKSLVKVGVWERGEGETGHERERDAGLDLSARQRGRQ